MFRYILVPAPGDETHDAVFRTALTVAQTAGGHLAFLHVQPDPQQLLITMTGVDFGGGSGFGELADVLQKDVDERRDRARQAVMSFCTHQHVPLSVSPVADGVTAGFQMEIGEETQILAAYARAADLTVLGRRRDGEAVVMAVLEAVLLDSGRPLLIAPAEPPAQIGRNIAIAWKDTTEAARAVASAMPLLPGAEVVSVMTVAEGGHADPKSADRLCRLLRWHNPVATVRTIPPGGKDPAEALLAAVAQTGADLLVMGGYSHSRVREVVFGGFTRRILRAANLPVLMAH